MSLAELVHASALEQARLLRRREIRSQELVALYLERIAAFNPALSAFVSVFDGRARRAARAADDALDRAARRGALASVPPLLGVPIGVKDLNFVRGSRTRMGSRGVWPLVSPVDDATVAKLRGAGLVVLGKLATSELGALPVTEPDTHPPTRNPWDPSRTAGGSSGGSGAAVAAGLLPWAQGSDGAGSIRIPSAFCGLVGIKPSRGRVANAFGRDDRRLLYTCGPLARSVADATALLDVMAGLTVGKPHWLSPPPCPYGQMTEPSPRLRIKLAVDSPIAAAEPQWAEAARAVGKALAEVGHRVEEAEMARGSVDDFLPIYQHLLADVPMVRTHRLQPATRWLVEAGRRNSPALARAAFEALRERVLAWVGDAELVLTPAVVGPPPPIGAWRGPDGEAVFRAYAVYGAFTAPFNITGQPAIALPVARSHEGLPIAVQLVGPLGREDRVLAVAREVEALFPGRPRVPVSPAMS
ncbi:amidase [Nannocystis radixulma]|uniref:Amidase n=1 Tax=Nannocystis radixulma TaxID=2995305 RepID=A0ABT5BMA6_9BACT|nr:amidase [Nannocystis radixulma]MDC0674639.1 amidase [Nannocystis radixulma]